MHADLNVLCWEGYDAPDVLGDFASRHGLKSNAENLLSDADTARRLVAGELPDWDVLNINNAWVRDWLCSHGVIQTLDPDRFSGYLENLLPEFDRLRQWAYTDDGDIIGLCQRFGSFNLVVNTNRIDRRSAEDQGFQLANDNAAPFGILLYDDFNIFHICIGAGLNPFVHLDANEIDRFGETAEQWFAAAALVSDDHMALNRALVDGHIDFYVSGGTYTVSPARLAGHTELCGITPKSGPIDGQGAIAFTEITSALDHPGVSTHANSFLEYLMEPQSAVRMAMRERTCNPVAQMADPRVFGAFTSNQLDAIQWDSLSEDIARCAMYAIPPSHDVLLSRLNMAKLQTR